MPLPQVQVNAKVSCCSSVDRLHNGGLGAILAYRLTLIGGRGEVAELVASVVLGVAPLAWSIVSCGSVHVGMQLAIYIPFRPGSIFPASMLQTTSELHVH